jgi:endonuclease-3
MLKRKAAEEIKKVSGPKDWKIVYETIEEFRKVNLAEVDTMGCALVSSKSDRNWRYHILCALQLSSQTKDPITFEAINKLKQLNNLSPQAIANMEYDELNKIINKVGFHNRKSKYMIETAKIIVANGGEIPDTLDEVLSLPGIGPKMAYLLMQEAWGMNLGIGVDTHVHRISNRLGWVKSKTPEETRKQLEDWLPEHLWGPVNPLLVGFGQTLCKPVKPNCQSCPVKNYCPKIGTKSK